MQEDLRLRADARLNYHTRSLWADQPTFEEAERLRLPSYHEAVAQAQEDRAFTNDLNGAALQMWMPFYP